MKEEWKVLFSTKVRAGSRTYFFDVKEADNGHKYLVISESKPTAADPHHHDRVMVFDDVIPEFRAALSDALAQFEKPHAPKKYSVEVMRGEHAKAYAKWTPEDDAALRASLAEGKSIAELCAQFGRNTGAISSRLAKLGLAPKAG